VGPTGVGVYLDFKESIQRLGKHVIEERYGNLFEMYERITAEKPYEAPMRIYPAPHYTMGGLWVDYNLMSTISGLFVLGEANFSDHGANRLGASALMQGLADGYFVAPYTVADYLAASKFEPVSAEHTEFGKVAGEARERTRRFLSIGGKTSPDVFHRELGKLMWNEVGMGRTAEGLKKALTEIPRIREAFWKDLRVLGSETSLNMTLEHAGRVADFLEFAEVMTRDALERNESCGGHFREEYQTEDGEARRDDEHCSHVSVWEYQGPDRPSVMHKEPLTFENVKPAQRSYK
jgi:succinate dehydrogenase / fumarate reductase flavoprotein subunit